MTKVGIIGSCVTRDAFEFKEHEFDLSGAYFPRTSLVSLMSKPLPNGAFIITAEQPWIKWVLANDQNKTTLKQLKAKNPDIICIDLIEERFNIVESCQTYITKSDEFVKNHIKESITGETREIQRGCIESESIFFEKASLFCKELENIFPEAILVIHRAKYCSHYRENGEIKAFSEKIQFENKIINARLDAYYDLLSNNIKSSFCIEVDKPIQLACKHHKWGVSPFHYINEYYHSFLDKLEKINKHSRMKYN